VSLCLGPWGGPRGGQFIMSEVPVYGTPHTLPQLSLQTSYTIDRAFCLIRVDGYLELTPQLENSRQPETSGFSWASSGVEGS
jgi:hypothetical protein